MVFWLFLTDCWFYAYILLPAFAINLNNIFEKIYVDNKVLKNEELAVFCFLIVCTSVSHEFFRFIFLAALFIGYFFHLVLFQQKVETKYIFLYCGLILLNLITFVTDTYRNWFSDHIDNNMLLAEYLPIFFDKFKEFFLYENLLLFTILTILYFLIAFVVKDNGKIRFFIYNLSLFASLFLFSICLIFVVPNYDGNSLTVLSHCVIRFLTKIFILQLILSSFSYFLAKTNCSYKKISILIVLIFATTTSSISSIMNSPSCKTEMKYYSDLRKILYILEKSFLVLNNNSDTKKILSFPFSFKGIIDGYSTNFLVSTYKIKDDNDYTKIPVCDSNMATEQCINQMKEVVLKETGYIFTEQELSKLDFQKMYENYKDKF